MSTYAIGDIQGCYKTFRRLLKRVAFDPAKDKLWIAGDLINRGPKSLDVLRFVRDLGDRAICVLGNHEIYLLALHYGVLTREKFKIKALEPILKSKDRQTLIDWIRHWPLVHVENKNVLVHAGLIPCWTVKQAVKEARSIERVLQSEQLTDFLAYAYAHQDTKWGDDFEGFKRQALALHAFVHMRVCLNTSTMKFGFTGAPEDAPRGTKPWYLVKGRVNTDHKILFGHWSALGLRAYAGCVALDSGCVWGHSLSAYRVEDGAIFVEPSAEG